MPGFNPTTKHLLTSAPEGTSSAGVSQGNYQYIVLQDQKASGTNGGTGSVPNFFTRVLNTVLLDQTGQVGLSSNQFTLPAGTYRLYAIAPAYRVSFHILKLRNITDSADVFFGDSDFSGESTGDVAMAELSGIFSISSSKTFAIQDRVGNNDANTNLGISMLQNDTAVYTTVILAKIL